MKKINQSEVDTSEDCPGSPKNQFKFRSVSTEDVVRTDEASSGANKGQVEDRSGGIYKCRVLGNVLTVTLGWFQFGFGTISWTNVEPAFAVYFGWSEDETKFWGDVMTSVIVMGTMTGSLIMAS